MTSPIWPVMVKPPLPFILLASMKRMSPPAGVQARPTATPGRLTRSATSVSTRTLMPPRNSLNDLAGDDQLFGLAFDDAARLLAADRADDLLEFAHAGFARVVAHDVADRLLGKLDAAPA